MLQSTLGRIIILTVLFLILDSLWLGYLSKQLYLDTIGPLLRLKGKSLQPNWIAALVVYIALISGILIFVLPKAHYDPMQALLWGSIFGFVTYATYDFTNLAVLTNWSLKVSIIDTLWGMILCGLSSSLTALITR